MSKIENRIPEAIEKLKEELTGWTRDGADEVNKQIKAQGDLPKSGDAGTSAPGESWANQSGALGGSFTKEEEILKTTLGSTLERAKLETGIKNSRGSLRIQARPTIQKAIDAAAPTLRNLLREACDRAQKS